MRALRRETKSESMASLPEEQLLTVEEVSNRLRVSRSSVYGMIERGELPSIKLGKSRRIPHKAVVEFVQKALAATA
jgi:excisionase family DNA binding protein